MNVFLSLAVSLTLTLLLELGLALCWRVKREDLRLVALANVLTNPVVVLCHIITRIFFPAVLPFLTAALELGAFSVEGYLFFARSQIRRPWLFSLCANLFSYTVGILLGRFL